MTKILVIDDEVRDRGLLVAVLEEKGYDVILADNGGAGLMLLSYTQVKPHVLICPHAM